MSNEQKDEETTVQLTLRDIAVTLRVLKTDDGDRIEVIAHGQRVEELAPNHRLLFTCEEALALAIAIEYQSSVLLRCRSGHQYVVKTEVLHYFTLTLADESGKELADVFYIRESDRCFVELLRSLVDARLRVAQLSSFQDIVDAFGVTP